MKLNIKKCTSVLLSVIMALGISASVPASVSAVENDEPISSIAESVSADESFSGESETSPTASVTERIGDSLRAQRQTEKSDSEIQGKYLKENNLIRSNVSSAEVNADNSVVEVSSAASSGMSVSEIKNRLSAYSDWFDYGPTSLLCPKYDVSESDLLKYINDITSLLKGEMGKDYCEISIEFQYTPSKYSYDYDLFSDKMFEWKSKINVNWTNWSSLNYLDVSTGSTSYNDSEKPSELRIDVWLALNGEDPNEEYSDYNAKVMSLVQSGRAATDSDSDLAFYFAEWLDNNVVYDGSLWSNSSYTAIMDGRAVCGGFANAFKDLCNAAGIPALVPINDSLNHAWNEVFLDGKWYSLDLCNVVYSKSGNYYKRYFFTDPCYNADNEDYIDSIKIELASPSPILNTPSVLNIKTSSYNLKSHIRNLAQGATIDYSSSDSKIVSVDKNGKITPINKGEAVVKAVITANGKTYTLSQKIKNTYEPPKVNPTKVSISSSALTLGVGEKYTLKAEISPSNAVKTCTWSSSNTSVATVSNGIVTAKKSGSATITVKTSNGKTARCKVTVKPAPSSVKMNPSGLTLGKGETYTISETTNSGSYANASNLKWSSSNANVATVTKGSGNKAKITAKGTGTATIKITLYNGKTASCKVTVKSAPSSVKMNPSGLTLGKGETYTISETTNSGSYANAANLKWSSSNANVATVTKGSGNKAKITAKGTGTATIKITLYNGKTAICKVTVKPAPSSVKMNPSGLTLGKGETYTISETTNSGSYANAANLKWSSSNANVATVTKGSGNKAKITAKGTGTATIKITLYNGKTAICKVTVKPAPSSVKMNPSGLTLGKGETYTISETTNSESYANAANLKWSSSDTNVATVTKGSGNKAKITAKGTGTATIKITLYNGKTAICKVTVKSAPLSVKINSSSLTLGKGETCTISESTDSGSYANAANLKWSSSDTNVATVTKGSGNKATITATGTGTATVKITLYNGKTANCEVSVI